MPLNPSCDDWLSFRPRSNHGVSFATGFSAPAFDFSERRRRQRSFNAHFGIEMAEGKYSKTRKPHWAMP
jgi:hypothetical protein